MPTACSRPVELAKTIRAHVVGRSRPVLNNNRLLPHAHQRIVGNYELDRLGWISLSSAGLARCKCREPGQKRYQQQAEMPWRAHFSHPLVKVRFSAVPRITAVRSLGSLMPVYVAGKHPVRKTAAGSSTILCAIAPPSVGATRSAKQKCQEDFRSSEAITLPDRRAGITAHFFDHSFLPHCQ